MKTIDRPAGTEWSYWTHPATMRATYAHALSLVNNTGYCRDRSSLEFVGEAVFQAMRAIIESDSSLTLDRKPKTIRQSQIERLTLDVLLGVLVRIPGDPFNERVLRDYLYEEQPADDAILAELFSKAHQL